MNVSTGKRNENERAQTATTQLSVANDARLTVREARDATQLTQAVANKLQELGAEAKQAAADLQRDLRNAPGAATASNETRDAASRALDEIAGAEKKRLERLTRDVERTAHATSGAAERSAPAADQERALELTKSAVHEAIREVEQELKAHRQEAAGILVDPARSAADRARDLESVADRAFSSTVRFAEDEGSSLDRARQNAERTGATITPDEAQALDKPLRDTLGKELADRIDDDAKLRLAVAARQDAVYKNGGGNVSRQLADELGALGVKKDEAAALAGTRNEKAAAVQYASEATSRLSRGNEGEKLAAEALAREKFLIASYKPDVRGTNQGGVDIVALQQDTTALNKDEERREHVTLIDNKALTRDGNVTSVSALTTNLEQNIRAVAKEFAQLLRSPEANQEQRDIARRVLDAIAADHIRLAVTNANVARDGQFTSGTAGRAKGLEFINLVLDDREPTDLSAASKPAVAAQDSAQPNMMTAVITRDQLQRAADALAAEWSKRHADEVAALAATRASIDLDGQLERARQEALARTQADARAQREEDARKEAERVLQLRDDARKTEES
jgi:hypothetical protein